VHASSPEQIDAAFARLVEQRVNAVFVSVDPFFADRREQIVGLAARNNLPAIYDRRDFAAAGGLISYGSRYADSYRQAGIYVGRILKGEKAANLPIQLPTRFELAINIKTAKALGIQLPSQLLLAADEVIE
jgi:putative ABC transport system substrate-binding protein